MLCQCNKGWIWRIRGAPPSPGKSNIDFPGKAFQGEKLPQAVPGASSSRTTLLHPLPYPSSPQLENPSRARVGTGHGHLGVPREALSGKIQRFYPCGMQVRPFPVGTGMALPCPSQWDWEGSQWGWDWPCYALHRSIGKNPNGIGNDPAMPFQVGLGMTSPCPSQWDWEWPHCALLFGIRNGPAAPFPFGSGRIPMGLGMAPLCPSQRDWEGSQ